MTSPSSGPVLALDLGTTHCKAVLVAADGAELAREVEPITTRCAAPGRAEQDPEEVLRAADSVTRAILAGGLEPVAIALSSAMHGIVALDASGRPVTRLRTWADARGDEAAVALRGSGRAHELHARTGTPVHGSSPMCKIAQLRTAEPDTFARARWFAGAKELLCERWLGVRVVDESIASATGLLDLATRSWCDEALSCAGIDAGRLSRPVPVETVLDGWRAGVVRDLGLPGPLPVVIGASDGALANLGVGADVAGIAAVTVGTSAAVRCVVDTRVDHASHGMFCYVADAARFVVGGAINNAGLVVDWLGGVLFEGEADRAAAVLAAARRSPPGARGARFAPRLVGERFPDYGDGERASFTELSREHGRDDLCRAVLEGIARAIAPIAHALDRRIGRLVELRGGGGLLRSELFAQMLADEIGVAIALPASIESSAIGAARLARRALALPGAELPVAVARRFEPRRA